MKITVEHEKVVDGGVRGHVKGRPAETWTGEHGNPNGYIFSIYSPSPGAVRVTLTVMTGAGHLRTLDANERLDLRGAIVAHYKSHFPNCVLSD